ncbi:hypothetical protein BDA99DRAFT_530144 [Phascolomyces articulosus]|uniref:SAP domain-containing protein n=1 Tax=Phascolomyces articulosus TaxID=60185 RepID=A0AAD5P8C9_9FUNG|nr:hypothetical protein BDA99DRAFT_530144 [Phascolomyces articulosus]
MLLRTCQQSLPNRFTRTFTTSRVFLNSISSNRSSWTRSGLMRLRKGQLEDLARRHQMNAEGTKSDIVERLMKQPEVETPLEHSISIAVAEQASRENNLPGTKETLMDSLAEDVNSHVESQPGSGGTDPNSATTAIRQNGGNITKDLESERWMEAFELKLGSSRIRSKPKQPSMFSSSKPSRAPSSTVELPQQPKAISTTTAVSNDVTSKDKNQVAMPDDIDKAWVKAFEQKTCNRDMRQRMLGKDTFRASTMDSIEPTGLDWIQTSKAKDKHDGMPHEQLQKSVIGLGEHKNLNFNNTTDNTHYNNHDNNSTRNWIINSLVGSSLLIWICSGQDGFSKIVTSLTTSSS